MDDARRQGIHGHAQGQFSSHQPDQALVRPGLGPVSHREGHHTEHSTQKHHGQHDSLQGDAGRFHGCQFIMLRKTAENKHNAQQKGDGKDIPHHSRQRIKTDAHDVHDRHLADGDAFRNGPHFGAYRPTHHHKTDHQRRQQRRGPDFAEYVAG
ncbi:MAG: hypothetical protein BWY09_03188 [Candidatus Hydrogenedentes bacterium ADurb.Bin179]|nr:MAG: hypothetical protein BWY09_03188 [Candidatus Hydrogenedentes bacterium ADurb.Bin179]